MTEMPDAPSNWQREREPGDRLADRPRPAARGRTRTGGRTSSTCRCCTSTRRESNPLGEDFDYAEEFEALDVEALKRDLVEVMTTSQDWWPADFGHYGPLFIRMSWHAAGTYRIADGRGGGGDGAQRFAPLNSWPDNANLDKARRLLWPIKQKYGQKISWADLLVFAGNVALESMGFKTFGFGFGREDVWEPEEIFWGPEDTWLGDERYSGDRELAGPLGAVQMGLIYVNPEGPNGNPDPLRRRARHPRDLRPHGDERRGDGRAHRRRPHVRQDPRRRRPPSYVGPEPEGCPIEQQGLGWKSTLRHRQGQGHDHQRPRGAWTADADAVGQRLLREPVRLRVGADQEPGRREAVERRRTAPGAGTVPDAHDPSKRHAPMMLTTDLALRVDPVYEQISRRFLRAPRRVRRRVRQGLVQAAAPRHGPGLALPRPVGPGAAAVAGPGPGRRPRAGRRRRTSPPSRRRSSPPGCRSRSWSSTAWASAATFRGTDKRGGANGARIRLAPQKDWEVNEPGRAGRRCCRRSRGSSRSSTARSPAARRSRWPT